MHDVVAAFKWVVANIAKYGGDARFFHITLLLRMRKKRMSFFFFFPLPLDLLDVRRILVFIIPLKV
jgi:hypothetical protein